MTNPIEFVLFDAYGTLVELDNFFERLQRGFEQQGLELPVEVVTRAAYREIKHYMQHSLQARDRESWLALRRECAGILADGVREQGYRAPLKPAAALKVLNDAIVFRPFPETVEVLEELRNRGVAMGIISNWDFSLGQVLADMELARHFRFILTSASAGREKPALEIFQTGLELARHTMPELTASNCCYVGDHYDKDVVPSRAIGIRPVWLVRDSRDQASGETHHSDDATLTRIGDLRELLPIVG